MVALNQNSISPPPSHPSAPTLRQTPPKINSTTPTPIRLLLRARYYDPHTAEFISPDPLEYVDGMSLFRGYFAGVGLDPNGTQRTKCGKKKCLQFAGACDCTDDPPGKIQVKEMIGGKLRVHACIRVVGFALEFGEYSCDCCKVQLWVKGSLTLTNPDQTLNHTTPAGHQLNPDVFGPDSPVFGYKNCFLVFTDRPGLGLDQNTFLNYARAKRKYILNLDFELRLYDTCQQTESKIDFSVKFTYDFADIVNRDNYQTTLPPCGKIINENGEVPWHE